MLYGPNDAKNESDLKNTLLSPMKSVLDQTLPGYKQQGNTQASTLSNKRSNEVNKGLLMNVKRKSAQDNSFKIREFDTNDGQNKKFKERD